jgi:hypothetical protein
MSLAPWCFASKLDGTNCRAPYPWAIKGCREYFSANVVGTVDIGMNRLAPFDFIPATGSCAGKTRLFLLLCPLTRIIIWQRITIEKTRFAGLGFFGEQDGHANRLSFVGQHLDKLGMRDLHKFLVVLLP